MRTSIARIAAIATGSLILAGTAGIGAAPARPGAAPARPQAAITFAALERRALAMGIRPTELKIKRMTAEIEGRDAQGRKVEVTIDPRSGQVLNREFDD